MSGAPSTICSITERRTIRCRMLMPEAAAINVIRALQRVILAGF